MLPSPQTEVLAGEFQVSGRILSLFNVLLLTQELAAGKSSSVVSIGIVDNESFGSGVRPPVTIKTCKRFLSNHIQSTWSPFESVNDPQAWLPRPSSRSGKGPMKPVRSLEVPVRSYLCVMHRLASIHPSSLYGLELRSTCQHIGESRSLPP